jgi:hypothetical protein
MKRCFLTIAVLALLIYGCSPAAASPEPGVPETPTIPKSNPIDIRNTPVIPDAAPEDLTYTDPYEQFSLILPAGWKLGIEEGLRRS